jgi:voltage-gated sodium channel
MPHLPRFDPLPADGPILDERHAGPKPGIGREYRVFRSRYTSAPSRRATVLHSRGRHMDRRVEWRSTLAAWVESDRVQRIIIALIIVNAIALGLETSRTVMAHAGGLLRTLEALVLGVFVVEIALKLVAFGPRFFRSGWNLMDFLIVAISLIPGSGPFQILRSLRILRVLRLMSTVKRLRQLTESLLAAIPSIGWILFMLGLVFYVFAVIGTELFGQRFPDWFGSLGASMYTLFQIMTLESWSMGIARPVMESFPWAWLYFLPFILISAFTILNLFIGIIVSSMQSTHWEEEDHKRSEAEDRARREREEMLILLRQTSERLARLERELERGA